MFYCLFLQFVFLMHCPWRFCDICSEALNKSTLLLPLYLLYHMVQSIGHFRLLYFLLERKGSQWELLTCLLPKLLTLFRKKYLFKANINNCKSIVHIPVKIIYKMDAAVTRTSPTRNINYNLHLYGSHS